MLVVAAVCHTLQAPFIYLFWRIGSGFVVAPLSLEETADLVNGFVQYNFATNGLFFTVIW